MKEQTINFITRRKTEDTTLRLKQRAAKEFFQQSCICFTSGYLNYLDDKGVSATSFSMSRSVNTEERSGQNKGKKLF